MKRKSNSGGNDPKAKASKANADPLDSFPHVALVSDWLLVFLEQIL